MSLPDKIVVRAYAPVKRRILLGVLVAVIAVALAGAFELGRYSAGTQAIAAIAGRQALLRQIAQLTSEQHGLRVQLASTRQARIADAVERSEVAREISKLQAQVAQQQQDIQFYRGLVSRPGEPAMPLVSVQQFRVVALPQAGQFALRFTLSRTLHPEQLTTGTFAITLVGSRAGAADSIDLSRLTGKSARAQFSFRYFQTVDQDVTLPAHFKPDHVTVEVRPAGNGARYQHTFAWLVQPS